MLCFYFLIVIFVPSFTVNAKGSSKTVRVGWNEAPFYITDEVGRRSGYTYDYLQKIDAYTGWDYEYVEAGWSELMDMLKNGEIDMMGNISYMEI